MKQIVDFNFSNWSQPWIDLLHLKHKILHKFFELVKYFEENIDLIIKKYIYVIKNDVEELKQERDTRLKAS